jgi:hypothetical protein
MSLSFEPNDGQAPVSAMFVARTTHGNFLLEKDGVRSTDGEGRPSGLHFRLVGAGDGGNIVPELATGGVANYYRGPDPRGWQEMVPLYSRVRYREVYRGIDLVLHGSDSHLEYDFEVAPGVDPSSIALRFGQPQSLVLARDGSVNIHSGGQGFRLLPPKAFQDCGAQLCTVPVRFSLAGSRLRFQLGAYDHGRKLVIDPVIAYTVFYAPPTTFNPVAAAVDVNGNLVLAGSVPTISGTDGFVSRLDANGNQLYYTQISNGPVSAMTLDSTGNAYVSGQVSGDSFSATSSSPAACGGSCSFLGFAAKLGIKGTLTYSTLLSPGRMAPAAVSVDSSGQLLVTGAAYDDTLPLVNAYQSYASYTGNPCGGCPNGEPFLAKLNSSGTNYVFSTYFGSLGQAETIAQDASGHIYISGLGQVPMQNPLISSGTVFVSEFSADGKTLLASTYYGGDPGDPSDELGSIAGTAVASDGGVYVVGRTWWDLPFSLNAPRLPVTTSWKYEVMFAVRFLPGLSGVKFATYLGAGIPWSMALDASNNLYVAGFADPATLTLVNPLVSGTYGNGFVMVLDKNGQTSFATQYGGQNVSQIPTAIAVDKSQNIYIAGSGVSSIPPGDGSVKDVVAIGAGSANSAQSSESYGDPAPWVTKISPNSAPQLSLSYFGPYLFLRDVGSAPLQIQSITSDGTLVNDCPATLAPATACAFYSFNPVHDFGAVVIQSNASASAQTYTPDYRSAAGMWLPLFVRPAWLQFPSVPEGVTLPPQSIQVWNVLPTAQPISSIVTGGSITQTNNCPSVLASGASCTIDVSAAPAVPSTGYTPQLAIITDPQNAYGGVVVPVSFTPASSGIELSTTGVNFGPVAVGTTSFAQVVGVTNASGSVLPAPAAIITGDPGFSVGATACANGLQTQQSCGIALSYIPTTNMDASATLTVSDGGYGQTAQLTATGFIPSAVAASPFEIEFPQAILGIAASAGPVTLTNSSKSVIPITGISFGKPDFSETDTCQGAVPASGSCTITVVLKAQTVTDHSTNMTITFSGTLSQVVAIDASNVVLPVALNTPSLDFGPNPVGVISQLQWIGLVNYSFTNQNYSLSVTGPFSLATADNRCGSVLQGMYQCGFAVQYTATATGEQTGTVIITIPGLSETFTVPLQGSGFIPPPDVPFISWVGQLVYQEGLTETWDVFGANFVSGSQVLWNGMALATVLAEPNHLIATIPAASVSGTSAQIVVANPAPNAAISSAVPLIISTNAAPQVNSASISNGVDPGGNHTLTVNVTPTSGIAGIVVEWGSTALTTTYISPWQISALVPPAQYASPAPLVIHNWAGQSPPFEAP